MQSSPSAVHTRSLPRRSLPPSPGAMLPSSSFSRSAVASPSAEADEAQLDAVAEKRGLSARGLHPALFIVNWIVFSNITIIFNKWLIDTAGFRYPILLTCWHLIFAALATQLLARTTTLLDSRHNLPLTRRLYVRTIVPIGVAYSGSLVCSNVVYLYLSVAFIQMLKSAAPVAVLCTSWVWGVADPSLFQLLNILVIVFGVALASAGEIDFSWIGFLYQVGGILFEAVRLIMIQVMLSAEGLRMDPLVGLYYYAPICAVMNFLVAGVTELPRFQWDDLAQTGFGMLFLNALVAFVLNIASVFLIGKTSGLVMTLTGTLKNILLIAFSVIIWGTHITILQSFGYTIALVGLTYYSLGYDQVVQLYQTSSSWVKHQRESSATARLTVRISKLFVMLLAALLAMFLVINMLFGANAWGARDVWVPDMFSQR